MSSNIHHFDNSMTVLDTSLAMTPLEITPTVYQELDQKFAGFSGCTLVARHSFDADWPTWEMHPQGDELVCLLGGRADMILYDEDGQETSLSLHQAGSYIVVPRGRWHTARNCAGAQMMFVTPGEGTLNVAVEDFPEGANI